MGRPPHGWAAFLCLAFEGQKLALGEREFVPTLAA